MKPEHDDDTPIITQGELSRRCVVYALVGFGLYLADAYFHRSTDPLVDVGRLADVATVLVAGSAFWTVLFDLKLFAWFMRRFRRLYIEIKEYMEQTRQSAGEMPNTGASSEPVVSPLGEVTSPSVEVRPVKKSLPPTVSRVPKGVSYLFGAGEKRWNAATSGIVMMVAFIVGTLVLPSMCTSGSNKPDSAGSGEEQVLVSVPGDEVETQQAEEGPPATPVASESTQKQTVDDCSYIVQRGDSCSTIAESYGVDPYPAWLDIARLNDIRSSNDGNDCPIAAGTELRLPRDWCQ